jgi:hypothetical protein
VRSGPVTRRRGRHDPRVVVLQGSAAPGPGAQGDRGGFRRVAVPVSTSGRQVARVLGEIEAASAS